MSISLKGSIVGNSQSCICDFLQQASTQHQGTFIITTKDPSSNSQISFHFKPYNFSNDTVCLIIVYSSSSQQSFSAVQNKWVPKSQNELQPGSSFVIIIGVHYQNTLRTINSQDAQEYAASNGVFHMQIQLPNKRNLELILKVMRIRAAYLLKKNPSLERPQFSKRNLKFPFDLPMPFQPQETPQFSSRTIKEDIFSPYQEKKPSKNRYEDIKTLAEAIQIENVDSQKMSNLSFANISENSDDHRGLQYSDSFSNDEDLINIDTLGSPSWQKQRKVPPLSMIGHSDIQVSSERNSSQAEQTTERILKDPLLVLQVTKQGVTKKIEVFQGDSAYDLAQMVCQDEEGCVRVANQIYEAVSGYCKQIHEVLRVKRTVCKVKVSLGSTAGEIVIREGDSLEQLARNFVKAHQLPSHRITSILRLLQDASSH